MKTFEEWRRVADGTEMKNEWKKKNYGNHKTQSRSEAYKMWTTKKNSWKVAKCSFASLLASTRWETKSSRFLCIGRRIPSPFVLILADGGMRGKCFEHILLVMRPLTFSVWSSVSERRTWIFSDHFICIRSFCVSSCISIVSAQSVGRFGPVTKQKKK